MPFFRTSALQVTRLSLIRLYNPDFVSLSLQERHFKAGSVGIQRILERRYLFTNVTRNTNNDRENIVKREVNRRKTSITINSFCTKAVVNEYDKTEVNVESSKVKYQSDDTETASTEDNEEINLRALVELELELYRQEGLSMPSAITEEQWSELLTRKSRKARRKYLVFLWKNEKKKENRKIKKEEARLKREEEQRLREENNETDQDDGHIQYGLWRNSMFLYMRDTTINHYYHSRLASAMIHGQPLVLDLDFDSIMTSRERQNCAYQLQLLFAENRVHPDPYNLFLCNTSYGANTFHRMKKYIPTMENPEFPLNISQESYLNEFPKEKLVYLTPHCREEMTTYDHDAIYIIGAIVDTGNNEPVTLAKAKREGIRMQKLPLDRYLEWGLGGKCLTLNQIISILLDIKHTGDWRHALRHVPRRKLRPPMSEEEVEAMLLKKLASQRKISPRMGNHKPARKIKRF